MDEIETETLKFGMAQTALAMAIDFCKEFPTEDREIEVVKIAKAFLEFLKGQ